MANLTPRPRAGDAEHFVAAALKFVGDADDFAASNCAKARETRFTRAVGSPGKHVPASRDAKQRCQGTALDTRGGDGRAR